MLFCTKKLQQKSESLRLPCSRFISDETNGLPPFCLSINTNVNVQVLKVNGKIILEKRWICRAMLCMLGQIHKRVALKVKSYKKCILICAGNPVMWGNKWKTLRSMANV